MLSGFLAPFVRHKLATLEPIFRNADINESGLRINPCHERIRMCPISNVSSQIPQFANCISRFGENKLVLSNGEDVHVVESGVIHSVRNRKRRSRVVEVVGNGLKDSLALVRLNNGTILRLMGDSEGGYVTEEAVKYRNPSWLAVSREAGGFCVAQSEGVKIFNTDRTVASISTAGGPVAYSAADANVLILGGESRIKLFDVREGRNVSCISLHAGSVSYSAYTNGSEYDSVRMNPVWTYQVAGVSGEHGIVQIFDSRKPSNPVAELALPGRESILSQPRECKHIDYSDDGKALLIVRPGKLDSASCIMSLDSAGNFSSITAVPLCPSRYAQIQAYNTKAREEALGMHPRTITNGIVLVPCESDFEFPLGASFDGRSSSLKRIVSLTSKGRILHVEEKRGGKNRHHDSLQGFPASVRTWFNYSSAMRPVSVSPKADCSSSKQKKNRENLFAYEQVWIQWFVGACRGVKKCRKHPRASTSIPGSAVWLECLQSSCRARIRPGPPKDAYKGQVRYTRVDTILFSFGSLFGFLLNESYLRDYLQFLTTACCDWCEAQFEDDCFFLRVIRAPINKEAIAMSDLIVEEEHEEDSELSDMDEEEDLFGQKRDISKKLVLDSLVAPSAYLNIVSPLLVDELKRIYPIVDVNRIEDSARLLDTPDEPIPPSPKRTAVETTRPEYRAGF